VKDLDYDCLNDATGEVYLALAMRPGVVLSVLSDWQPGSDLAYGNHVWLYNPAQDVVIYYAHLKEVLVRPGEFVAAGAPVGAIGRTGKNAIERRSPTHVHVMEMRYGEDGLEAYNFWRELVGSGR